MKHNRIPQRTLIQIPRNVHNANFSKTQNTAPQNRRLLNQQETVILHLRTSSDLNDCSRTRPSTKVLATQQEVPNPHAAHKRQPETLPNSSGRIRTQTDNNENGQKQIQKLSNVNFLLENCSGKSIFDKVQLSTGAMPKSSVTFPSTNGRKNARNTHDEHTPLLGTERSSGGSSSSSSSRDKPLNNAALSSSKPDYKSYSIAKVQPHLDELATFR